MNSDSPHMDAGQQTASPQAATPTRRRKWLMDALALLWGAAEASVFFLPVEMLITWLALNSPLRALRAAGFALLGAVAGAALLYFWGGRDPFSAMTLLSALPGLSPEVLSAAEEALMNDGLRAVPAGVLSATTGKAHSLYAQALDIGPAAYLAVFAAIRAVRLLLSGCVAFCLGMMAQCFLSRHIVLGLWALAWAPILWRMFG